MASQRKVLEKGKVSEKAEDKVALFKDSALSFNVAQMDKEREKMGSSKGGEACSSFNAFFQAPPGKKNILPHWQEVDALYNRMRKILNNPKYMEGDRLSEENDMAVRDVLKYHLKCEEKTGPGIDYIKIDQIFDEHTRCFWVVHVDGSEIDFSYHKCLKEKASRECPDLLDHYDALYKSYKSKPWTARRHGDCTRF